MQEMAKLPWLSLLCGGNDGDEEGGQRKGGDWRRKHSPRISNRHAYSALDVLKITERWEADVK